MSTLAYEIVDVFTDRPFAGNPLAVVFGAGELATEQMQALAVEFNQSETMFPAPVGDHAYTGRIFTPGRSSRSPGTPPSARRGCCASGSGGGDATQHCGAGDIGVRFTGERGVELAAVPRDSVGHSGPFVDRLYADLGLFPERPRRPGVDLLAAG